MYKQMPYQDQTIQEPSKEENEEYQLENEVGELKITYATDLEGDPSEIAKERRRFAGYSPAMHNMSQKTRHQIIERNELKKLHEADEVWKEVLQWVLEGKNHRCKSIEVKYRKY